MAILASLARTPEKLQVAFVKHALVAEYSGHRPPNGVDRKATRGSRKKHPVVRRGSTPQLSFASPT